MMSNKSGQLLDRFTVIVIGAKWIKRSVGEGLIKEASLESLSVISP